MFNIRGLLTGIFLASVLVNSPAAMAHSVGWVERFPAPEAQPTDGRPDATGAESPADVPDDVLGYYTTDGGKTIIPIKEQKGVAERIPSGISQEEFMSAHRMTPEAEAAIVHQVPPVPVIIDGTPYEPEQIHLFDGKQLGFTVGKDGQLYAFTSFAALEDFVDEQFQSPLSEPPPEYCVFYEYINYDYQDHWMWLLPGTTVSSLPDYYMNDIISSMKIRPYAANGCTLFEHVNLQGDYFPVAGGTEWENLGWYGWDNRASSLVVWPR